MRLQKTFCLFGLPVIFPETKTSSFLNTDLEVMSWFMHKATEAQLCLCLPAFKITYNWGLGHNYHYVELTAEKDYQHVYQKLYFINKLLSMSLNISLTEE